MKKRSVFRSVTLFLLTLLPTGSSIADFYVIPGVRGVGTEIKKLPYTISSSGFYYLTKDLNSGGKGITVDADNVTIDLLGFSLIGSGIKTAYIYGIEMNGRVNVEIRNGTVRDFGDHGIYNGDTNGGAYRLIGVRVMSNKGYGIFITGSGHLMKDCTATGNTSGGIFVGPESTVSGNIVKGNGTGINAGENCMVTWNHVTYNEGTGLYIFDGSYIANNTVSHNNQLNDTLASGMDIYSFTVVKENQLNSNKLRGIFVRSEGNVIVDNTVTNSSVGIDFDDLNNFYANNRARGTGTAFKNPPTGSGDGGGNVSF